jgi:hypothetical protein
VHGIEAHCQQDDQQASKPEHHFGAQHEDGNRANR